MGHSLIISCGTPSEIFALNALIASLKDKNPAQQITLLTYDDGQTAAHSLPGIDQVRVIEKQKIKNFARNTIFSSGHAINLFWQNLTPVIQQHWDEIYNFEADIVPAAIASMLTAKTKYGLQLNAEHNLSFSSNWALSDQFIYQGRHLLHRKDQIRLMANLATYAVPPAVFVDPENQALAREHFAALRHAPGHQDRRIVGISIHDLPSALPDEDLIKLLELILDDDTLLPVLLSSKNAMDLARLKAINQKFMNTIIAIQGHQAALAAAISELDILITGGDDRFFLTAKHGRVIYLTTQTDFYRHGGSREEDCIILARDKFSIELILTVLKHGRTELLTLAQDQADSHIDWASLYFPFTDEMGVYFQTAGTTPKASDFGLLIARYILGKLLHLPITLAPRIFQANPEALSAHIQQERLHILETTKTLLAALRSLLRLQDNTKMGQEFTMQLADILAYVDEQHLAALCCTIFKNQIENLPLGGKDDNIRQIETLLYQLRDHLQLALGVLRDLDDQLAQIKKDQYRQKAKEHLADVQG